MILCGYVESDSVSKILMFQYIVQLNADRTISNAEKEASTFNSEWPLIQLI